MNAQEVIDSFTRTQLMLADSKRFLEILDDDSEPNAALLTAVKTYKKSKS